MANRKISDLTALTAPATGDLLPIVDISEAAAADKNKKITFGELFASIPAGTAAAPGVAFEGYPGTGVYSSGADQVAISTNGVERVEFGTSEVLFNDGNNNYDFRIESDNNAYLFFVDASVDRLGIGHGSPATLVHIADTLAGSPVTTRIENFSSSANSDAVIELKTPNETYGLKANRSGARLDLDIGGTPKISITTGGLVGLGISSPSSLLHLADAGDISVGTTTGTKIGTATTQKLGFYNATPVVQPTAVADATTAVDVITQLNALLAKLRTLGIIAT